MCGIAGFANISRSDFSIEDTLLDAMQKRIAHRGPDDFGIWKSDNHQMGFAHRRLSIVDLSSAGHQPMLDAQQRAAIIFNGEIYNHRQVRKELEGRGYRYFSQTDTETVLYAYQEWGIDCLDKLDGMFAFALFDIERNELYLVRDRIGIKPLYFSLQGGVLSFASEIKALWELPWLKKEISPQALYHYLTFMIAPAPLTIFEGVYKLPAGFYLKLDAKRRVSFHEWYSPLGKISSQERVQMTNEQFCVERIRDLLVEATKKRMMADVPVGAFLSGGIDSSLNVALMTRFASKVKTFTVAFSDGPEINEFTWARKIAKLYGTDHHEVEISEKEAFNFFETMMYHHDEPLADCVSIPLYFIAKRAREEGVRVVQIGEGADELFFGYPMYGHYATFYRRYFAPTQKWLPAFMRQGVSCSVQTFFPGEYHRKEILANWAGNRSLFWSGAVAFNEQHKRALLCSEMFKECKQPDYVVSKILQGITQECDSHIFVEHHLQKLRMKDPHADISKQMLYLELKHRLPELLLMRADKMAMAASIEGRVPFLDYKLVEFALNLPVELKYKKKITKYLLKQACRGIIPDEIIDRKKVGFGAPTVRWYEKGAFFPAYYQRLRNEKNDLIFKRKFFTDRVHNLKNVYHNNEANFAVQQWTLQNLFAMR